MLNRTSAVLATTALAVGSLVGAQTASATGTDGTNAQTPSSAREPAAVSAMLPYPAGTRHPITQGPGMGSHLDKYNRYAVDFGMPANSKVVASNAGTVVNANWFGSSGIEVMINHGNNVCTHYIHLNRTRLYKGDTVKRGQLIGLSGATGNATGPHLHWSALRCSDRVSIPIKTVATGGSFPVGSSPISQNG